MTVAGSKAATDKLRRQMDKTEALLKARNAEIAERYAAGDVTHKQLAEAYGVTPARIAAIIRRQDAIAANGDAPARFDPFAAMRAASDDGS